MSLSDQERYTKIMYAVASISKEACQIEDKVKNRDTRYYFIEKIVEESKHLWHDLLKDQTYDNYWLLGGDSDPETVLDTNNKSVWAVSLVSRLEDLTSPKNVITDDDLSSMSSTFGKGFQVSKELSIENLLKKSSHKALAGVYSIYRGIEGLLYALRRYDDSFRYKFSSLDSRINYIQGLCFLVFDSFDEFAKAKVLYLICKILYCGFDSPPKKDPIVNLLFEENCHHWLRTAIDSFFLEELVEYHIYLVNNAGACVEKDICKSGSCLWPRLKIILKLWSRAYDHYYFDDKVISFIKSNTRLKNYLSEATKIIKGRSEINRGRLEEMCNPLKIYGDSKYAIEDGTSRIFNKK